MVFVCDLSKYMRNLFMDDTIRWDALFLAHTRNHPDIIISLSVDYLCLHVIDPGVFLGPHLRQSE